MKKQLPTDIENELAGSSVFFQTTAKPGSPPELPTPKEEKTEESKSQAVMTPRHHDTTAAREDADNTLNRPSTKQDLSPEDKTAATLEAIRKVVKQIGKEASTHRLTSQEKDVLIDIVYTYNRKGYKTSENEITRIAVNWLMLDYQDKGEQSVLARMLELLHK